MKNNQERAPRRISIWVPVTIAFIILIAAWTTLIIIANKHPAQTVSIESTD